uniref:Uncharacterized protein AlNc14C21G2167 n=1 Tax=Albugo laibachii Nc14 TaxID=890382 RepID=F0W5K2_9STRA|nr:conserved hypothetical protein [Albugo laibachii Nc14]|eukprot:CCA16393.1 conserved hypothetical protein [Albugo laibachii Nc14]
MHLNRFKDLWRKYGLVAIGTYFTMYGIVLGTIYISIENGLISKNRNVRSNKDTTTDFDVVSTTNKMIALAEDYGLAKYLDVERVNSKTGSFVIAWVATKFTEPIRLAITLAITPRIARFLGRAPKKMLK